MPDSYETLSFIKDGNIGRVELNRTERLNAVAMTGAHELYDVIQRITADQDLRPVTFTGAGLGLPGSPDCTAPVRRQCACPNRNSTHHGRISASAG